jgi:hypothetical protein
MSSEKRAASNSFGSAQMVKRQKSDTNLNGSAVAVVNGSARDGALIKAVCSPLMQVCSTIYGALNMHGRIVLADVGLGG